MTFRFLSARRHLLGTALRSVSVASLSFAACVPAHADKTKAPPPPRAAPQPARQAPQAFGGGRPAGGAMGQSGVHIPGQQSGVHIPGQQAGVHVPGQPASGGGYGSAAASRPVGSATLHVPSSVRPPAANGSALVHPVVAQTRPAPVRGTNRQEAPAGHPANKGRPGESNVAGKPGAARPEDTAARNPAHSPETHAPPDGVHAERSAPEARARPMNVPDGHPRDAYPIHDAASERATLQTRAHDFHTRDVAAFSPAERARWSHGAWSDGWHYGRHGWWWQVDGVWYPYAAPIYPFPEEVDPPAVYDGYVVDNGSPPGIAEAQIPADVARLGSPLKGDDALSIGRLPAAQLVASHCNDPAGDYPDVRRCAQPWVARSQP